MLVEINVLGASNRQLPAERIGRAVIYEVPRTDPRDVKPDHVQVAHNGKAVQDGAFPLGNDVFTTIPIAHYARDEVQSFALLDVDEGIDGVEPHAA